MLRPAGALNRPARRRLTEALGHLAAGCDMVIVDLTATQVTAPRALARSLRAPALELDRAGRCLLLVGAAPGLMAELDRIAVPVATLAVGSLPSRSPRRARPSRARPSGARPDPAPRPAA